MLSTQGHQTSPVVWCVEMGMRALRSNLLVIVSVTIGFVKAPIWCTVAMECGGYGIPSSLSLGTLKGVDFEEDCMTTNNNISDRTNPDVLTAVVLPRWTYRMTFICPYDETSWSAEAEQPESSNCPCCGRNVNPYTCGGPYNH